MKTGQFIFRAIPLIFMLCIAVMLLEGLFRGPAKLNDRMVGKTISAFDIPELNKPGSHFTPDSWKGKVVLINIFATWCEPCRAEHDTLMEMARSGKVTLYGIAWKDKEERVTQWLESRGNPYKLVGFDEKKRVTLPFSMTGVPETYLIDKKGVVRYHFNSSLTEDVVLDDILPLVEQLNKENAGEKEDAGTE